MFVKTIIGKQVSSEFTKTVILSAPCMKDETEAFKY